MSTSAASGSVSPVPVVLESAAAAREWSRKRRRQGRRVALVPTMGALHQGHLSLFDVARRLADDVIMSIFVNPAQFGPGEDYASYPRDLTRDLALATRQVDAAYVPAAAAVYAADHSTWVGEDSLTVPLEGACRPGHFRGVLTVVLKLLAATEPDIAVFGQKDAQQALAIRRMVQDLELPVGIHVAPTVREADGLALSSRNAYLDAADRRAAPVLHGAITACVARLAAGTGDPAEVVRAGRALLESEPRVSVDYLEVVDLQTLRTPDAVNGPVLVAGAVRLGSTRLIDNAVFPPDALDRLATERKER